MSNHPPAPLPALAGANSALPWRVVALCCGVGLILRLGFLYASGEPTLHSDESGYIYLALAWERFGFLMDAERFQWPPAWPWVLKTAFEWFGRDGLLAAKLFECCAALVIGLGVIGSAAQLGGVRAGKYAGAIWALYLPLAAYTHMLWSEPMCLACLVPAIWLLISVCRCRVVGAGNGSLLASGLCFGLALLVKESATFLVPLLCLGLCVSWWGERPREGLRRASLFALAVASVLLPWSLRNAEVYGQFVLSGVSLGDNAYHGLNARDVNFDLMPLRRLERVKVNMPDVPRASFVRTDPAGRWQRPVGVANTAQQSSQKVALGLEWVSAHPLDFLRTRVKKLADFVMPTSFIVRHQALSSYHGALEREGIRRLLILWAVAAVIGLLLVSVPAFVQACAHLRHVRGLWIPVVCAIYFTSTALLVSMSRFRIALVPWLMILVGVYLANRQSRAVGEAAGPLLKLGTRAGLVLLCFLWWVNIPDLSLVLDLAWNR